jgi:hypothetical protein
MGAALNRIINGLRRLADDDEPSVERYAREPHPIENLANAGYTVEDAGHGVMKTYNQAGTMVGYNIPGHGKTFTTKGAAQRQMTRPSYASPPPPPRQPTEREKWAEAMRRNAAERRVRKAAEAKASRERTREAYAAEQPAYYDQGSDMYLEEHDLPAFGLGAHRAPKRERERHARSEQYAAPHHRAVKVGGGPVPQAPRHQLTHQEERRRINKAYEENPAAVLHPRPESRISMTHRKREYGTAKGTRRGKRAMVGQEHPRATLAPGMATEATPPGHIPRLGRHLSMEQVGAFVPHPSDIKKMSQEHAQAHAHYHGAPHWQRSWEIQHSAPLVGEGRHTARHVTTGLPYKGAHTGQTPLHHGSGGHGYRETIEYEPRAQHGSTIPGEPSRPVGLEARRKREKIAGEHAPAVRETGRQAHRAVSHLHTVEPRRVRDQYRYAAEGEPSYTVQHMDRSGTGESGEWRKGQTYQGVPHSQVGKHIKAAKKRGAGVIISDPSGKQVFPHHFGRYAAEGAPRERYARGMSLGDWSRKHQIDIQEDRGLHPHPDARIVRAPYGPASRDLYRLNDYMIANISGDTHRLIPRPAKTKERHAGGGRRGQRQWSSELEVMHNSPFYRRQAGYGATEMGGGEDLKPAPHLGQGWGQRKIIGGIVKHYDPNGQFHSYGIPNERIAFERPEHARAELSRRRRMARVDM